MVSQLLQGTDKFPFVQQYAIIAKETAIVTGVAAQNRPVPAFHPILGLGPTKDNNCKRKRNN